MKTILITLILTHLTGLGLAMAPVQDSYRVEVLQARVNNLLRYKLKCILKGWDPVDENIWR